MTFKITILVLGLFVFLGCGKKEEKVLDPGPKFSLSSSEFTISDNGTIELRRDDPHFGAVIEVKTGEKNILRLTEKKLTCGPIAIMGKISAEEKNTSLFRINSEEFPGLETLPMNIDCRLQLTAMNQLGSTATQTYLIKIHYDRPPNLKITRITVAPGRIPAAGGLFLVDSYTIENQFEYPVGFIFQTTRAAMALVIFFAQRSTQLPPIELSGSDQYPLRSNGQISLSPNAELIGSSSNGVMRFRVPPHQVVKIESFFSINEFLAQATPPRCGKAVGIYIISAGEPRGDQSLRQWEHVEYSAAEEAANYSPPYLVGTLPGINVDNRFANPEIIICGN